MGNAYRKGDAVAELQTTTGAPVLPALEHGPSHVDDEPLAYSKSSQIMMVSPVLGIDYPARLKYAQERYLRSAEYIRLVKGIKSQDQDAEAP